MKKALITLAVIASIFTACKDDTTVPTPTPDVVETFDLRDTAAGNFWEVVEPGMPGAFYVIVNDTNTDDRMAVLASGKELVDSLITTSTDSTLTCVGTMGPGKVTGTYTLKTDMWEFLIERKGGVRKLILERDED